MKIVMITPTTALRRLPFYRWGGKIYGQSNSITGPLILGGILKKAGHEVAVYEELNANIHVNRLIADPSVDVFCFSLMTSNAPRGYELADRIHKESRARVIFGGMHPTTMPEEALKHADQVVVGEAEKVIVDVVEGRRTEPIVQGIPLTCLDEVPFPDYSILKTVRGGQRHLDPRLSLPLHLLHDLPDVCALPSALRRQRHRGNPHVQKDGLQVHEF